MYIIPENTMENNMKSHFKKIQEIFQNDIWKTLTIGKYKENFTRKDVIEERFNIAWNTAYGCNTSHKRLKLILLIFRQISIY